MGKILISRISIRKNMALKELQKTYLKAHGKVRARHPKGKLGKVVHLVSEQCMDCVGYQVAEEQQVGQNNQKNNQSKESKLEVKKIVEGMSEAQIWETLKQADIKGLSGSGFPTYQKLKTVKMAECQSKYFIINAVACDPGLVHDAWLLKNHREEIEKGIEIVKRMIPFNEVIIAEPDKVPNRYPMGEERILIKQLLGAELMKEEIPAEKGYLVINVQTVYAIYKAFYLNEEQPSRYITVANINTGMARVAKVKMGQKIEELIKKLSQSKELHLEKFLASPEQIYAGMGIMDAEPITENQTLSAEIGFIGFGKAFEYNNEAKCKGCGACSRHCPKGIKLHKLLKAIDKGDTSKFEVYRLKECIECGTCSYYCKAGKNVMEILIQAKEKCYERYC